jgi:hypothetical protein
MMATAGRDGPRWSQHLVGNDGISFWNILNGCSFLGKSMRQAKDPSSKCTFAKHLDTDGSYLTICLKSHNYA